MKDECVTSHILFSRDNDKYKERSGRSVVVVVVVVGKKEKKEKKTLEVCRQLAAGSGYICIRRYELMHTRKLHAVTPRSRNNKDLESS